MSLTTELFLTRYPIFSELDTTIIEGELATNEVLNPVSLWNNDIVRDIAIGCVTAHTLLIDFHEQLNIGNQIALNSLPEKTEPRKLNGTDYYDLTPYGIKYQRLRQQILGIAICVL